MTWGSSRCWQAFLVRLAELPFYQEEVEGCLPAPVCCSHLLLQALLRQAYAMKMLQKQLSAEELKTQALVMVIQHLTEAAERAQAEACSLRTANLDLHTELQGRDAEVSDLRRTVQELRSSLAPDVKEEVALLLIHHIIC